MRPRRSFKFTGCLLAIIAASACLVLGGCGILGGKALPEAPVTYSKESGQTPDQLLPDKNLRKVFARYWGLRFAGQAEDAFAMEAPYFQEMVGINQYRLFVKGNGKNELIEMEIRGFERKTDYFCEIRCRPRFRTSEGEIKAIYMVDRWVNLDGRWFHVLKDPVVFPAAS